MSFFTLLTLLILIVTLNGQCLKEALSGAQYECGKTSVFDSSSSTFPSELLNGIQQLSTKAIIQITDMCSASYPFNLFTLKIPSENHGELLISTYEISASNKITIFTQDLNGVSQVGTISTTTESLGQGTSLEFYLSIDLASGLVRISSGLSTDSSNYVAVGRDFTDLKFNEETRFEFCTDSAGNSVASCTVQSLSMEDQYPVLPAIRLVHYLGSYNPVLVGSYSFDQKSGVNIDNQGGSLGQAQLGSATALIPNGKAPNWLTDEAGVDFTDPDQYILLPTFTPISGSPTTEFSFTWSVWLKIENEANTDGYIFRYTRSDLTQNLFTASLYNSQTLKFKIGSQEATGTSVLPYSTWNLLTVSYTCLNGGSTCASAAYLNSSPIVVSSISSADSYIRLFDASDVVLLGGPGGFKGKMVKLRIFTPGSHRLIIPTCDSGCLLNIGVIDSTSKNCLQCAANVNNANFYDSCRTCPSGTYQSGDECLVEEKVKTTFAGEKASEAASGIASGLTQLISAISSGSSIGVSAGISGKVFSNIKYLNISYSDELENALQTWTSNYFTLGFNNDIPDGLKKRLVSANVPYVFEKYQVDSCFLINFWEPLIMLLILVLFLVVIVLLDCLVHEKKKGLFVYKIIARAKVMILNFVIAQLYGMYGDLIFYALIDYQTAHPTAGANLLNVFATLLLIAAMLFGFFMHINVLKRFQNVKKTFGVENFVNDHEGVQVLFGDFKDQSFSHQSFLFILTVRDILFSLILTTLFNYPLAECILILLMTISMLLYLLIKRPFKDIMAQVQQVVLEVVTLAVNITVLILAVWDNKQMEVLGGRNQIGKMLIIMNMVFNFLVVFFMLVGLFAQGYEAYKEYKERSKIRKLPQRMLSLQNRASLGPSKRVNNLEVIMTNTMENSSENFINSESFNTRNQPQKNIGINTSQIFEAGAAFGLSENQNNGGLETSSVISSQPNFTMVKPVNPQRQKIHKNRRLN